MPKEENMPEKVEMMTRERLEELRARVFTDYQDWDVRRSQDGFQEAIPTGKMNADGNDLLALIDAEITRQSVTDEAVRVAIAWAEQERKNNFRYMNFGDADSATLAIQALRQYQSVTDEQIRTALDYVNDYKKVAMEYDASVGIFPPTSEEVRAWETVETALRQYQKPTDDADVMEIAGSLESDCEYGEQQGQHKVAVDVFDLRKAITALRQMRSEPCRCTEICGICNNPNYHIHSGIWWESASTEYGRENREIPTRHCPNCGRKLVKHDGNG